MIEWQFEHFKTFTPYEIMQQAAAALSLYEGENTDGANPKMGKLTDELTINTGHPAWMPDRDNGNLRVNTEDLYSEIKHDYLVLFIYVYLQIC